MNKPLYHSYEATGLWEMFSFKTLIIRARNDAEAKRKFRNSFKKGRVTGVKVRKIASPFMSPTYCPAYES